MIRFSAGLVVVALGVLIGGVVTSKLSLVYVSIAVSALALTAWAVGVFLKRGELREELFGGRPELVPAGAGAGAGSPAPERSASASQSPAPSPATAVPSAGQDRPAYGQDGFNAAAFSSPAQVHPTWTAKEPAPKPAPDRAAAPAGGWGSASTPPSGTPPVAPGAWDGAKAPPSVPAGPGATSADGGSADDLRSWFDRPAHAKPSAPSAEETPAAADTPSITDTDTDASGDVDVSADEDDDWPTRYSWLDDEETDETGEAETGDDAPASPSATDLGPGDTGEAEPSAEAEPTAEDDEPSAEDEPPAKQESGARLVTVVPGVPRYHEPDCILIRFMPADDVQQKSIPAAKAAKCTPCAACEPED